jgi:hypothetical protein
VWGIEERLEEKKKKKFTTNEKWHGGGGGYKNIKVANFVHVIDFNLQLETVFILHADSHFKRSSINAYNV